MNHLVMFLGRPPQSHLTPVEIAMDGLLRVAAGATLNRASATGLFKQVIVVTSDTEFSPPPGVTLIPDTDEGAYEFHFGQALWQVVKDLPPEDCVVYIGGGAGVLLEQQDWFALLTAAGRSSGSVTANNFFSADFVAWQPAGALRQLAEKEELPDTDNNLPWALVYHAGLSWQQMLPGNTRTVRTVFDIDTPTDAVVLKLWLARQQPGAAGNDELRHYLQQAAIFDTAGALRLLEELRNSRGEVLVMGRVSGGIHRLLEQRSHGQTRLLSEERGMRASGREANGLVTSLAGFMLDELGPERFFYNLSKLGTAGVIDSRVLFAHQKLKPDRSDRFNSDALQPDKIRDSGVRAFTQAARDAREHWNFPVLLGGHSLVAGDLMLLLEMTPERYNQGH